MCRHQCTKQTVNTSEDRIRIQDNYLRLEKKGLKTRTTKKHCKQQRPTQGKKNTTAKIYLKKKKGQKKKTHE